MLLRLFKGTGPGVIFLTGLTLAGFWISAFIDPQAPGQAVYETDPMPLYSLLRSIAGTSPLAGVIFSFSVMVVMVFLITWFNTSVFFLNERTFLPALFFILICALFPECRVINPVMPGALFLMLALMKIMNTYRISGTAFNFFDAGILISVGSLFYMNLIWFWLLVIVGIALLRTWNLREIAISVLGLITPYILILGLYYVLGKDIGAYLADIRINLFGETQGYDFSRLTIIVLILWSMVFLVSLSFLLMQMSSKKIKSRKTFFLLLWSLAAALTVYFLLPSASVEMIYLTAVPVCYIMAHFFVFARKKLVPEIIFSGFFLLVVLIQVLFVL
ncbi:MAG: DUF6427 family protein [Bacteroidota bacterium]